MSEEQADVVVVGAGPAGATTACWLADQGLSVALLEKGTFPRDKVCGDGLTPRATKQLLRLGIDVSEEAGWLHNKGLRVYGARAEPFELPWPTLAEFPSFGLVRKRADFDELLADKAVQKGATLHQQANVTGVVVDERTERVTGVTTKDGRTFTAPIVVAADGNSSPVSRSVGLLKNAKRPMGVACRTYFTWAPKPATTAAVSSVDPSSMTMISCARWVCARTVRSVAAIHADRLYVGTITETVPVVIDPGTSEGIHAGTARDRRTGGSRCGRPREGHS